MFMFLLCGIVDFIVYNLTVKLPYNKPIRILLKILSSVDVKETFTILPDIMVHHALTGCDFMAVCYGVNTPRLSVTELEFGVPWSYIRDFYIWLLLGHQLIPFHLCVLLFIISFFQC